MQAIAALLIYALPAFIGVAAIEAVIRLALRTGPYNWKASLASLADALTRDYLLKPIVRTGIAGPVIYWAIVHNLHLIHLNSGVAFVALFLGEELAYYWFHRCAHQMRWLWASHAVHHSPNELNFSAAYRTGVTAWLSGDVLFYAPLIWLGFPYQAVFLMLAIDLVYQFWLHSDWLPKLGWLEYVLNTPSHHRVHHSANLDYLDANYGGILIIFDRIFGTCTVERDDLPCRYGLVKPLTTNNPILIDFHEWAAMARDLGRARSAREVLGYLFGPPGWRPNGDGLTTAALRRAAAEPVDLRRAATEPVAAPAE